MPTIADLLAKTTAFFAERGIASARLDAELLIAAALDLDRLRLYMDLRRPLAADEVAACREAVRRRGQREPVAYIVGRREFLGWPFAVSPAVLIPRPETELIVEVAATWLARRQPEATADAVRRARQFERLLNIAEAAERTAQAGDEPAPALARAAVAPLAPAETTAAAPAAGEALRFADVGTGSGCVGISLAKLFPAARGLLTDISPEALAVARRNAESLGVSDRLNFAEGDLLDPVRAWCAQHGPLDLLVSNPPYVGDYGRSILAPEVIDHEPHLALFAGPDGLDAIRRLVAEARDVLRPGAFIALEIGTGRGGIVGALLEEAGFGAIAVHPDLAGHDRVVQALAP